MLSMRSNMLAINAGRHTVINDKENAKTAEKLASGYRINRAADDAAGLSISEKMRRQIRGLTQGTYNAEDGVSFVQVADGAMDEIHSMLQRMNELTVKSLNGTCTERERAALNDELDHLRSEIDRIGNQTEFNDQPVFEEHEDSYYQLAGNRKWDDRQTHIIPPEANDLVIHLPDTYIPNEFSFTVPPGVYTTQELIDEIDDALGAMAPYNPGFVFEYTEEGFCNLNYESPYGTPTDITSVDGALAYLLYDFYGGGASSSLLGTTEFEGDNPLIITRGENDALHFYVEGKNVPTEVSITFPPGSYTRSQLISFINSELAKDPKTTGVIAKEYGESCIQITGGDDVSIVGLKGNMFKYESPSSSNIYTSVFYDNTQYGRAENNSAFITGQYHDSGTRINITDTNNMLRFSLNNEAYYTITIPEKKYTLAELVQEINNQINLNLDLQGKITASSSYNYYYSRLSLVSTVKGNSSQLVFDTSNSIFENTYRDLFLTMRRLPNISGSGVRASLTGSADLSGSIQLDADASLSFNVDNKTYKIDIGGNYQNLAALVSKLNESIKAFDEIKNKIEFAAGVYNELMIQAKTPDVQKIYFDAANQNSTYKKLFTRSSTVINQSFTTGVGSVQRPQGSTQIIKNDAVAKSAIPSDMRSKTITIDNSCNQIGFSIGGVSRTITLQNRNNYTLDSLVAEMNRQFQNSSDEYLKSMKAFYRNGNIEFASTPLNSAPNGSWYLYISSPANSAWKAIVGTRESVTGPSVTTADNRTIITYYPIQEKVVLDDTNNTLLVNMKGDDGIITNDITVTIPKKAYNTREELKKAVQDAIDANSVLKGKISVELENDKIKLISSNWFSASGSFYNDVLVTSSKSQTPYSRRENGESKFPQEAFIIGRQDLTKESVEIISGSNDTFIFDFTHKENLYGTSPADYEKEMQVTIPEGVYSGNEIVSLLQEKMQEKFEEEGLGDFSVEVTIGKRDTHVVGSNDSTALQIAVSSKSGKEPDDGYYILDGIRGSAAGYLFYKTTIKPIATYITGTKDITNGITFKLGQNVLTLSADSVPYQYTFPEEASYTAEEFADLLNDRFKNGDDNGNKASLRASIDNGALKISHIALGSHTITDIGGSARGPLFFEENGKNSRNPIDLLVGSEAGDSVELPRMRVNSCALGVNSITISRPKYANKALGRIKEAISLVSTKRSAYGSMQNRLEHTISINKNVIENTQASESAVRDADMSYEIMRKTQISLILQASQTMLAQANQQARQVINLLQQ